MPDCGQNKASGVFTENRNFSEFFPVKHKYIILFCAAAFFFWAALYLYVPILPVYARSLGANLSMVGTVIASYALPQLLFRIPAGIFFDAIKRRKLLIAGGILTTSVGALALGLAPNLWLLFLARAITGLGAVFWVTIIVYFAAYYPQQDSQRAIGIISFVQGAAIVTATACGGVIAEALGFGYTFWVAAFLGVISLIALIATPQPPVTRGEPVSPVSWQRFKGVATFSPLLMVSLMGILVHFANFAVIFGFIPIYATQIGASSTDLGIVSMLSLATSAVAALTVAPTARRLGNSFTILAGAILMGVAILIIPLVHNVHLLEAVMVINGLGTGILRTILMSMCVQGIPPEQRATAMGFYQAVYSAGMLLGPLISGYLADSLGLAAVFYLSASFSLIIAVMAYLPVLTRSPELKI